MTPRYHFLSSAHVRRLYTSLIAPAQPSQPALLESALASPITHKAYGQANLVQLAAILSERIIRNHAYQNGNKRTALVAADMFLKMNGYALQRQPPRADNPKSDAITEALVKVAAGEWSATELAAFYEGIVAPLPAARVEARGFRNKAELH